MKMDERGYLDGQPLRVPDSKSSSLVVRMIVSVITRIAKKEEGALGFSSHGL